MHRTIIIGILIFVVSKNAFPAEDQGEKSCISVVVNGIRTLPYDCLTQQLLPESARANPARERDLDPLSARTAMKPSNELGLFNRSGTSIRMGSNFGRSALPQRPPLPSSHSPLIPGR